MQFSDTTGILQKKTMWFIGVEVEQETSAPPLKKDPGSAPDFLAKKKPSLIRSPANTAKFFWRIRDRINEAVL